MDDTDKQYEYACFMLGNKLSKNNEFNAVVLPIPVTTLGRYVLCDQSLYEGKKTFAFSSKEEMYVQLDLDGLAIDHSFVPSNKPLLDLNEKFNGMKVVYQVFSKNQVFSKKTMKDDDIILTFGIRKLN